MNFNLILNFEGIWINWFVVFIAYISAQLPLGQLERREVWNLKKS